MHLSRSVYIMISFLHKIGGTLYLQLQRKKKSYVEQITQSVNTDYLRLRGFEGYGGR